ncbi:uncharacterized [Tachysurus ichikawai]
MRNKPLYVMPFKENHQWTVEPRQRGRCETGGSQDPLGWMPCGLLAVYTRMLMTRGCALTGRCLPSRHVQGLVTGEVADARLVIKA